MNTPKILYIGKHAVLERDEVSLFHEIGCKVFSLHGAYTVPEGHPSLPRPGIPGLEYMSDLHRIAQANPSLNNIPIELIEPFDVVIVTGGYHDVPVISNNWKKFNKKIVVWRSIGQSNETTETALTPYKAKGMKVVRYSLKEILIPNSMGGDVMIRFYKDPDEFSNWNGNTIQAINVSQSLKGRALFLHYQQIMDILKDLPSKIYGTGNEDLGIYDGGNLSYHQLKEAYRDNRVFLYAGTWPAPYTLSLIEALLTGMPVVAIGKELAEKLPGVKQFEFYEVHELIRHGEVGGYIGNTVEECRKYVELLLSDYSLAKKLGDMGRSFAIAEFGKENIKKKWLEFFESL